MTAAPSNILSTKTVSLADRTIGSGHPPFIIAELSANHGGDFDRAIRIINAAAKAGVDAVKFQAYTAESLTLDIDLEDFKITAQGPWQGRKLFELYQEAATPFEWFPELFAACKQRGIIAFASPFDKAAVDMLEDLEAPAYKIASFEAVDHELIAACAQTGKPLIISVGLCTSEEISEALDAAYTAGAHKIILLQCNSAYPANTTEANLHSIPALSQRFDVPVGYSDHTVNNVSSIAACALGACVIEKHVIDSVTPTTPDSDFSLTPDQLKALVTDCHSAWRARGVVREGPTALEASSLAFRRSLYVVSDIPAGSLFTRENVKSIRPGHGLAPKHLKTVLSANAARDLKRGEALDWKMITLQNSSST